MGGFLSRVCFQMFEFCNEIFVGIASGAIGVAVLSAKGLSEANYMSTIFVVTITAGSLVYILQGSESMEPTPEKIVFITGCDSGLGYSLAQHVSELGFTVVAGCQKLSSKGAKELKKNSKIILVELDITSEGNVNTAVNTIAKYIESCNYTLWALVNNAGCMVFGEYEWLTHSLIQKQVNLNLLGTFSITKAFCPLLRKYKGRLIVISSHCALSTLPGLSVYGATKAGLLAWCDGLRVELGKYGVSVVSFIPGSFIQSSNIMAKHDEHIYEMNSAFTMEQQRFYGDYFKRYNAYLSSISGQNPLLKIPDPALYKKFEEALLEVKPKTIYIHQNMKYRCYHTIFKYAPTAIRDFFVAKFMQLPEYSEDPFVPDGLA